MAVFLVGSAFGVACAKTRMDLSNQFPPSHFTSKGMVVFAAKVDEYSKGTVEVKLFDSAQLFKDTEIVEAIQEGTVNAGLVPVNKWSGMIPVTDIFEVPFIFQDLSSIKKFIEAGAGELLDKEFQKKGAKTLMWVDLGYVQFWNSKRPLTKPEDFKGMKMRTFSTGDAETLKALGASPVVMSSSEMYMAMQRGTVDGGTTGMPAALSRKLQEVQKFMTKANYATPQFVLQANLKWWEKLSKNEQDAILKAGRDAEEWIREAIIKSEDNAEKVLREAGIQIYTLNPASREIFIKATESVQQQFISKSGPLGKKLVDIAMSLK
ncbi:MAG: DctP family TRAP transporter solute-binding subunit [Proteobacteria bacterium]|nr:DctP family TRAP transporter solute-binding subunit [Pseudomonadota bacterium]